MESIQTTRQRTQVDATTIIQQHTRGRSNILQYIGWRRLGRFSLNSRKCPSRAVHTWSPGYFTCYYSSTVVECQTSLHGSMLGHRPSLNQHTTCFTAGNLFPVSSPIYVPCLLGIPIPNRVPLTPNIVRHFFINHLFTVLYSIFGDHHVDKSRFVTLLITQ